MMTKILTKARGLFLGAPHVVIPRGRWRTQDIAFQYRMGAGFQGDVNRTHPFSVEPCPIDTTNPPLAYGYACVIDAASHKARQMAAGDGALTAIYGVTVRPYPTSPQTATNFGATPIGSVAPPTSQPIDVLRSGYILVPVVGSPNKGDPVYVWIAASGGGHVQGGFEAASGGGSTILLSGSSITFNGPPDANGITELAFRP